MTGTYHEHRQQSKQNDAFPSKTEVRHVVNHLGNAMAANSNFGKKLKLRKFILTAVKEWCRRRREGAPLMISSPSHWARLIDAHRDTTKEFCRALVKAGVLQVEIEGGHGPKSPHLVWLDFENLSVFLRAKGLQIGADLRRGLNKLADSFSRSSDLNIILQRLEREKGGCDLAKIGGREQYNRLVAVVCRADQKGGCETPHKGTSSLSDGNVAPSTETAESCGNLVDHQIERDHPQTDRVTNCQGGARAMNAEHETGPVLSNQPEPPSATVEGLEPNVIHFPAGHRVARSAPTALGGARGPSRAVAAQASEPEIDLVDPLPSVDWRTQISTQEQPEPVTAEDWQAWRAACYGAEIVREVFRAHREDPPDALEVWR